MRKQSHHAQLIADIQRDAVDIFGSTEKAEAWLASYNVALNAAPICMLETDAGITEVQRVLNAIKYGGVV